MSEERLGLPYMGSKNSIARGIVDALPGAEHFIDLFAGGCSVTHAAILSGKWDDLLANDIEETPRLFLDAVSGRYADERRWISREDFQRLEGSDPYVRYCWSFGNRGATYLYGEKVETWKKAVWSLCLGPELPAAEIQAMLYSREFGTDRRYRILFDLDALKPLVENPSRENRLLLRKIRKKYIDSETGGEIGRMKDPEVHRAYWRSRIERNRPKGLSEFEQLEFLGSLQRLERLQSLQSLRTSRLDYRAVRIPRGSVVYCDIPYEGTTDYLCGAFDHGAFYKWAQSQEELVAVSSYSMPRGFARVWGARKYQTMNGLGNSALVAEGLFIPERQVSLWNEMKERSAAERELLLFA